ncbi:peptidase M20 [Rhodonellum psychrophilum GCM71 = DSM 17998]|uniref:Peptidase M20 n=2 Tax=Rhodonellum TaxID=336827 RepID=U5BW31_9BACT|nr:MULTISPECIES: amidohydrolase [Rhodonellum]ERM80811.1 peptidase M20 [Rhodonellum psychrophilum GCM71 = DSM 17998]SDY45840.1 amidohydrolase [Rhodonellum ikkaensis]
MKQTDLKSLLALRKTLHKNPEVSGQEIETSKRIKEFFIPLKPDLIIEKLGGEGIAFVFEGLEKGPVSLYRCELDGLPIQEKNDIPHISTLPGKSHVCGHDGHMAIISGLGLELSKNRPQKGKVVLLFQPAEETGEGAAAILKDPKFQQIKPDYAFALHNLPGYELNQVIIKKGAFAASSVGMIVKLHGRTSHSAHPEAGNSPAEAMCKIILALERLPDAMKKFTLVTVGHAQLGNVAFGTTPGEAVVMATLRSFDNETRDKLVGYAEKLIALIAKEYGLTFEITYTESFAATHNDPDAWHLGNEAAKKLKLKTKHIRVPFRWSEDFGLFSDYTKTLLFGLGSGKKQPQLHEPNFDFPDEIIPTGIQMFLEIMAQIHGKPEITQS